ncbi:copper ABC transporter substrate-binding protein [Serratia sp. S1B]|nr:copper ABC transporter substrate-binding protein [Serratia sp. S1B]
MRQSIKIALFGVLSVIMAASTQAEEQHHSLTAATAEASSQTVISGVGVVKDIDLKNMKITIAHEAIPSINWPAMTMRFTFTELNNSISVLKVGSHVNFTFVQQGNISLLQEIKSS